MDDGALVRLLQGPIVRLPDAGLYRLAARRFDRKGMRLRDCFDESRREGFPEMEPKVAAQAVRLVELTDRVGLLRDALTVADILNRLLEESGYLRWAELSAQRDGSPRALLNLRKVFQLAGRFERDLALAGIGDFVRHLDQVIDADLAVGEAAEEVEGTEAVSLLTVHAAKGLEFPVVFLVNLRPPRPRDTERLFFDPDNLGVGMKNWRGERHPRYVETSPGGTAGTLAVGGCGRVPFPRDTRRHAAPLHTSPPLPRTAGGPAGVRHYRRRRAPPRSSLASSSCLSWGCALPGPASPRCGGCPPRPTSCSRATSPRSDRQIWARRSTKRLPRGTTRAGAPPRPTRDLRQGAGCRRATIPSPRRAGRRWRVERGLQLASGGPRCRAR